MTSLSLTSVLTHDSSPSFLIPFTCWRNWVLIEIPTSWIRLIAKLALNIRETFSPGEITQQPDAWLTQWVTWWWEVWSKGTWGPFSRWERPRQRGRKKEAFLTLGIWCGFSWKKAVPAGSWQVGTKELVHVDHRKTQVLVSKAIREGLSMSFYRVAASLHFWSSALSVVLHITESITLPPFLSSTNKNTPQFILQPFKQTWMLFQIAFQCAFLFN